MTLMVLAVFNPEHNNGEDKHGGSDDVEHHTAEVRRDGFDGFKHCSFSFKLVSDWVVD